MNHHVVKERIKQCTVAELESWRQHAVKCLDYYLKYWNEFEVQDCKTVIAYIDEHLNERKYEK